MVVRQRDRGGNATVIIPREPTMGNTDKAGDDGSSRRRSMRRAEQKY
jgi:hypothetical protein